MDDKREIKELCFSAVYKSVFEGEERVRMDSHHKFGYEMKHREEYAKFGKLGDSLSHN